MIKPSTGFYNPKFYTQQIRIILFLTNGIEKARGNSPAQNTLAPIHSLWLSSPWLHYAELLQGLTFPQLLHVDHPVIDKKLNLVSEFINCDRNLTFLLLWTHNIYQHSILEFRCSTLEVYFKDSLSSK